MDQARDRAEGSILAAAPSLAAVLAEATAHQAHLRALLAGYDPRLLATRPPNGNWSAIENIRHLLFAEQLHLGRYVPGGLGLSPMGLPQRGMQGRAQIAVVGTDPTTDLDAVFDEWERVRVRVHAEMDLTQPQLPPYRLPRHLRHQQTHGKMALRAIRLLQAANTSALARGKD
jgi:hypothetical protein